MELPLDILYVQVQTLQVRRPLHVIMLNKSPFRYYWPSVIVCIIRLSYARARRRFNRMYNTRQDSTRARYHNPADAAAGSEDFVKRVIAKKLLVMQ